MPLQHWNKEVGIQSYHPEAIVSALNEIIDYCNELERRLAEVEKPKRNYLSDDYTLCVRCNNIHHKDIECNNK